MHSIAQQALEDEQGSSHPLAGQEMTGSDIIVQVLAQEGVDTIFGYSGGAILPTYDAVFRYNEENNDAMPLIVPPVPMPATQWVMRPSVWRQISGPVVL